MNKEIYFIIFVNLLILFVNSLNNQKTKYVLGAIN